MFLLFCKQSRVNILFILIRQFISFFEDYVRFFHYAISLILLNFHVAKFWNFHLKKLINVIVNSLITMPYTILHNKADQVENFSPLYSSEQFIVGGKCMWIDLQDNCVKSGLPSFHCAESIPIHLITILHTNHGVFPL